MSYQFVIPFNAPNTTWNWYCPDDVTSITIAASGDGATFNGQTSGTFTIAPNTPYQIVQNANILYGLATATSSSRSTTVTVAEATGGFPWPSDTPTTTNPTVSLIGAGANGRDGRTTSGGGGGGGGAFASSTAGLAGMYSPGIQSTFIVGNHGSSTGSSGQSSNFDNGAVVAIFGAGGNSTGSAGSGGLAVNCEGDVTFSGGNGAASSSTNGGGGGGSATISGAGGNASGTTGGTGSASGGTGGAATVAGGNGGSPGAGGGGSGSTLTSTFSTGGVGKMVISYTGVLPQTMASASVNGTTWTFTVTLSSGSTGPMSGSLSGLVISGLSGGAVTLSNPVWSGETLTATGSRSVAYGETGGLTAYTYPLGSVGINDSVGHILASFSNLAVTNSTPFGGGGGSGKRPVGLGLGLGLAA